MATFRSSAGLVLALVCIACSSQRAQEPAASVPVPPAPINRDGIQHVLPKPDSVGPMPARFAWTAASGVDEYTLTVENEVDVLLFQARTRGTSLDWPKGNPLDPGTYFWRVLGTAADGRRVADSGRAAFVVAESVR
jgi:hypothetical protein